MVSFSKHCRLFELKLLQESMIDGSLQSAKSPLRDAETMTTDASDSELESIRSGKRSDVMCAMYVLFEILLVHCFSMHVIFAKTYVSFS